MYSLGLIIRIRIAYGKEMYTVGETYVDYFNPTVHGPF